MWIKISLCLAFLIGSVVCFPQSRVVNGTDSNIQLYPFMVSLRGASGSHSCGSSIIDPYWILTAAHCVVNSQPNRMSIQYGLTEINSAGPNIANVEKIIVHKGYAPSQSYANDIALLKLQGKLIFNHKTIDAVALPEQGFETTQTDAGTNGRLLGWGLNATGGVVQKTLQQVDLKIYSDQQCSKLHNGATNGNYHICGGVDEGGKGQCSGDSGGPLVLQNNVQVGIVSWSVKPCTVKGYPGVYTKVANYIDWIKANMV